VQVGSRDGGLHQFVEIPRRYFDVDNFAIALTAAVKERLEIAGAEFFCQAVSRGRNARYCRAALAEFTHPFTERGIVYNRADCVI